MLKLLKLFRNVNPPMVLWLTSKTIQLIWQHFCCPWSALKRPFCNFNILPIFYNQISIKLPCVTSYRISPHFLLVHGDRSQRNTIVFCIRNTFLLLLSEKAKTQEIVRLQSTFCFAYFLIRICSRLNFCTEL